MSEGPLRDPWSSLRLGRSPALGLAERERREAEEGTTLVALRMVHSRSAIVRGPTDTRNWPRRRIANLLVPTISGLLRVQMRVPQGQTCKRTRARMREGPYAGCAHSGALICK
jgi:hypothetical protein